MSRRLYAKKNEVSRQAPSRKLDATRERPYKVIKAHGNEAYTSANNEEGR